MVLPIAEVGKARGGAAWGGSVGEQELSSEMPHPSGDAKRQLEMFGARDRGAGWGYECELPAYREY